MTKYWSSFVRKAGPVLSAGLLLQANGCTVDTTALAQSWLTSIASNLLGSLVFGSFNVPTSSFF